MDQYSREFIAEKARLRPADPTRAPQGRTATRPRPVRPLRPTGSARLRTPNRRGELPASHPRSYHLLADSGDRSCFERGGLGCGRSQLRVTVPYQPDRVGQRPPLKIHYKGSIARFVRRITRGERGSAVDISATSSPPRSWREYPLKHPGSAPNERATQPPLALRALRADGP